MGTYKFTFKCNQFLSLILSLSLVFASIPARAFDKSYLATPGTTELSKPIIDSQYVDETSTNHKRHNEQKISLFRKIKKAIGTRIPTYMVVIIIICSTFSGLKLGEYIIFEELKLVESSLKTDSDHIYVWPGYYAIGGQEEGARYLSTHSLSSCWGLMLYDKDLKIGIVAHCYWSTDIPNSLNSMIQNLRAFGVKQDTLEAYIIRGEEKWSRYRIRKLRRALRKRNITVTYEDLTGGKVSEFTFDTYTGQIEKYRSELKKPVKKTAPKKSNHNLKHNREADESL